MIALRAWDARHPSRERLRAECDAMRVAIVEALRANLRGDVLGIYTHGSSTKAWDTPIDYVPELSDLDIHVLLRDPVVLEPDLERAFAIQSDYLSRFRNRVPGPLHEPRPQIQVINRLVEDPMFTPPPSNAASTLFGVAIDEVRPQFSANGVRAADIHWLNDPRNVEYLEELPMRAIDRPGKYLWQILRDMAWRVGPVGPRVLSVGGADFETSWGGNRTHVHGNLVAMGEVDLARDYADFYEHGWDFFLSSYQDGEGAQAAVLAATRVLRRALEIGAAAAAAQYKPPQLR